MFRLTRLWLLSRRAIDDLDSPTFRAAWQAAALVDQAETAVELLSALSSRVVDPQRSELRLRVYRLLTQALGALRAPPPESR